MSDFAVLSEVSRFCCCKQLAAAKAANLLKLRGAIEFVTGKMANTTTCKTMAATSNGVWQGDVPIHFALPLLIVQIVIVLCITRALAFLLKPLRQPRVIAEIIVSSRLSLDAVIILHSNVSCVSTFALSGCKC